MVPTVELPPVMPLTSQVTFWLESPVTVAWNCCVWPRKSVALVGWIVTVTLGGGGVGGANAYPQPASANAAEQRSARKTKRERNCRHARSGLSSNEFFFMCEIREGKGCAKAEHD